MHARCAQAALTILLLAAAAPAARAQDEAPEDLGDIPVLAPAEVEAPRLLGGPPTAESEASVTATRGRLELLRVPNTVSVLTDDEIRVHRAARSLSDALEGLPGVLVQKTGPLQHSPYVRGFTGYQNLMLIDGIRLNNASFRAGPNQYLSLIHI